MKRLLTIFITLVVLMALSDGLAFIAHTAFIDYSFFTGLVVTVIIWFFTSKGGFTSRKSEALIQGTTGIKLERQKYEFSPKSAFFTSLAYTILSLLAVFYQYRSYF